MTWFSSMSDISQIACGGGGGVEGEWGTKLPISLHYLAQGKGQRGGVFPLMTLHENKHFNNL
jgi:hypothetical protein